MPPPVAAGRLCPGLQVIGKPRPHFVCTQNCFPSAGSLGPAVGQTGKAVAGLEDGLTTHELPPTVAPHPASVSSSGEEGMGGHLQGPFWLDVGWCGRLRAQRGASCTLRPLPISQLRVQDVPEAGLGWPLTPGLRATPRWVRALPPCPSGTGLPPGGLAVDGTAWSNLLGEGTALSSGHVGPWQGAQSCGNAAAWATSADVFAGRFLQAPDARLGSAVQDCPAGDPPVTFHTSF